jgi:hypothetical protein
MRQCAARQRRSTFGVRPPLHDWCRGSESNKEETKRIFSEVDPDRHSLSRAVTVATWGWARRGCDAWVGGQGSGGGRVTRTRTA